ncbi:GDP-fucose protein O-fucosyltransferase 1-like [Gigantopelta aegis]|uniref:GDP-fucose protein O-fucosyltransferase 1-like n=1 Tax=Gigantopelta aegis TaxID=1735272 RepID=UPI001B88BDF1|nr:GDP-fucose protein O-fucosyltransferase 1-like [Gigantopelta aegis]XP_041368792.1 GDP-fucose protein O-fucosyltransferase 1-like [Gigantopelta aegis]XP_041368793.1 GDP-fucose protein O-fucosyltransferase 1-like [Gigantopelta aegis]
MLLILLVWINSLTWMVTSLEQDTSGYVVYCPCMGRFGNQADQFLGALAFAKTLNRTLILPPWVEYRPAYRTSVQVPFDTYFKVASLREYHRVITMETFMKHLAPTVWPPEERFSFCPVARSHSPKTNDCNAKYGNPFGPFWDTFGIDFVKSEIFGPLPYDGQGIHLKKKWDERFPPEKFPVLSFTAPPSSFPVQKIHVGLQKYVKWSNEYEQKAKDFIKTTIVERPYIGIHLRNGIDFKRACDHISDAPRMFASAQCLGYSGEKGKLTKDICFPSDDIVIRNVKKEVKRIKAKVVFVASDNRYLIKEFSAAMKKVKFVKQPSDASPHLDLALLGKADHFIGNCISTFSAFVKRERDANNLSTSFFAFEPKKHDEL